MDILKPGFIKPIASSQQKRSVSTAKLHLVEGSAGVAASDQTSQPSLERDVLAVHFQRKYRDGTNSLPWQSDQPMLVRNFFDEAKAQIMAQPDQTLKSQANSDAETVAALLA